MDSDLANNLKILQWNCRSILNKKFEYLDYLKDYDIALLCETMLSSRISLDFNNYTTIRSDRQGSGSTVGGGVMINISKRIPYEVCNKIYNNTGSFESIAITVPIIFRGSREVLTFVSFYRPPGAIMQKSEWLKLSDSLPKNSLYVLGGDANCHSSVWDSNSVCINLYTCSACKSGQNLLYAIDETSHDLLIANNGSSTCFKAYNNGDIKKSALDLTIVSSNLYLGLEWSTIDDLIGSDHFPINYIINTPLQILPYYTSL